MTATQTIYYLEMTSIDQLRAKPAREDLTVVECEIVQPQLNRFLYQLVGKDWAWTDLDHWTDAQWQAEVSQDFHRTWVAYLRGAIVGYYELQRPDGENVEIRYFGLAPQFLDQGLGGPLLSQALRDAWNWPGTRRVWLHTCSLDHPAALANYQARGMQLYKQEVEPL
ncbi:GNAT family N-acetyltransferase [Pseudomonas sp. S75]|uniref:GNAT family N-acetyltransferase n=1 Tax=unclassified Pseudomonas TaxID=196821 RepID=UPI001904B3B8|nr:MULTISPECIES: GNAT family N-acetyltransferase [unclassified Pseudomonas]MBJ9973991.1 GNAT family N-acetyltransferase [Pseudomonas sp. S30]MBK0152079.1 GNAT family N-acetyltransferase [Pseudomonas sp. S75]